VIAFSGVASQWRVAPVGQVGLRYIGLDYAGVKAGLECAGVAVTPELWEGVRTMEAEMRTVLNAPGAGG